MADRISHIEANELQSIVPVLQGFSDEAEIPVKLNPGAFVKFWEGILEAGVGTVIVAKNGTDRPVGVLGGVVAPDQFDGQTYAAEMFWYVDPEHRGTIGFRLLNAFEKWGKESGAVRITMVHLETLMPARIQHAYERRGYRKLETSYMKEV